MKEAIVAVGKHACHRAGSIAWMRIPLILGARMMRILVAPRKAILAVCLIIPLSACERIECDEYRAIAKNHSATSKLVEWADSEVFNHHFRLDQTSLGWNIGPGDLCLVDPPNWPMGAPSLKDREVRLVGEDALSPNGIFFSHTNYKGILVAQEDIDDLLRAERIQADEILYKEGRVAVICRTHNAPPPNDLENNGPKPGS